MEEITALSLEQAQRALLLFFDLLPPDYWEGQAKPSVAEIEAWADELQDRAPAEDREPLRILLAGDDPYVKAGAAKDILLRFRQSEALQPLVDQAVSQAEEPHMAPIPVIIGAYILVLALMPEVEITQTDGTKSVHLHWDPAGNATKLVARMTEFLKALPRPWTPGTP